MTLFRIARPVLLSLFALGACSSNTTKQIKAFTDKMCACSDVACATTVQAEYLEWWGKNQRARGSEGDRKDIEKAMQRYATCFETLVGPAEPKERVTVPQVDLSKPTVPPVVPAAPAGGADEPVTDEPATEVPSAEAAAEGQTADRNP